MANTEQDTFVFRITRTIPYGDKIAHIVVFGTLTLLLNAAIHHKGYPLGNYHLLWGSLIVFIFATLEEASQFFIPSRTLDIWDYLSSLFGILIFSIPSYGMRARPD